MSNIPIIKTTSLFYSYAKGSNTISDINICIEKGSVYGFLGPNGSGKTTMLSLVLGLLPLQQGSIEVFGQQFRSNRVSILKRVGSLIETPSLYGHLTAVENLEVYRRVYGATKERLLEVLRIVDLENTGTKVVKKFSLGMKQRLAIALALLPRPELLILDEPTNGLDPNGIIELRELIRKLNKDFEMTIVISSHILAEVEKMVSHVGIISKGKMLFQGTLHELHLLQQKQAKLHVQTSNNEEAYRLLHDYNPGRKPGSISVNYSGVEDIANINRILSANHINVYLLQPEENNLEQLFINLTTTNA
jgi:lantibiotic transport system ATP-binding protein